ALELALLLHELVSLDVYYRRLHGEEPQAADYGRRFPEFDPDWLADAGASRARRLPRSEGAPCRTQLPHSVEREPSLSAHAPAMDPPPYIGRYRVERVLGEGGF